MWGTAPREVDYRATNNTSDRCTETEIVICQLGRSIDNYVVLRLNFSLDTARACGVEVPSFSCLVVWILPGLLANDCSLPRAEAQPRRCR